MKVNGVEVDIAFLSQGHLFRTVMCGLSKQPPTEERWAEVRKATERTGKEMPRMVLKCGRICSSGVWGGTNRQMEDWSSLFPKHLQGGRFSWLFRRGGGAGTGRGGRAGRQRTVHGRVSLLFGYIQP